MFIFMQSDPVEHRKKRPRSPSYPGIGLEQAIERARVMYDHEHRNMAPINAIIEHWGYRPGSGNANTAIAALRKFGLLEAQGTGASRHARLTDLALKILLDPREDSPERLEAIRVAALEPSIHRELLDKYPDGLPSDSTMIYYLTLERQFTDGAARELAAELRATLLFAGLTGAGDTLERQDEDKGIREESNVAPVGSQAPTPRQIPQAPTSPRSSTERTYRLPLLSREITLQGDFPLDIEDWEQLRRLLDVMKPGLIKQEAAPAPPIDATD
jgi:hypothetical protein